MLPHVQVLAQTLTSTVCQASQYAFANSLDDCLDPVMDGAWPVNYDAAASTHLADAIPREIEKCFENSTCPPESPVHHDAFDDFQSWDWNAAYTRETLPAFASSFANRERYVLNL